MIRRRALRPIVGVCVLMLLLTACFGSDTDPDATAVPTTEETVTLADPVEFVLAFNEYVLTENWDAARSSLVEEFRQFDDEIISQSLGLRMPPDVGAEADDWDVERNERFTTVRVQGLPVIAIVLRRDADGGWLVDPGPYRLATAKLRAEGITNWGGSKFSFDRAGFAAVDNLTFSRHIHEHVEHVGVEDGDIEVTLSWMFERGATGELPIANVSWSTAGASGAVDVTWATAQVAGGVLTFPQAEDEESPVYLSTFSLHGVPQASELQLHIDGMLLFAPGIDDSEFSTTIHVPMESYPQPARMEVPAVAVTPDN